MKVFYDPVENKLVLCIYASLSGGGYAGITEDSDGRTHLFSLTEEQFKTFEQYIIGEF